MKTVTLTLTCESAQTQKSELKHDRSTSGEWSSHPWFGALAPRIVHLKGYVFFSSCVSIVRQIEEKFQHEDKHQVGLGISPTPLRFCLKQAQHWGPYTLCALNLAQMVAHTVLFTCSLTPSPPEVHVQRGYIRNKAWGDGDDAFAKPQCVAMQTCSMASSG